jgi:transposase-like protein
MQATEGAKFWAGVITDLANRGIRDTACRVLQVSASGFTTGSAGTVRP